jgi:ribosomal protein L11 methyltransferase
MNYIEIDVRAAVDAGELIGFLGDAESLGAWEGEGFLRLYWPEARWNPEALADLKHALEQLGVESRDEIITLRSVPDQDWNAKWAASLHAIRIGGRIRVRQSWNSPDPEFSGIELIIDPKRAFGSGYHATTQLVIEWLEERVRGGERVLDVGTGSGILAMISLRLGAASVMGVDNDPIALECARECAQLNGFGSEMELRVASFEDLDSGAFDIVVANLDIRTMPSFCPHLRRLLKPGGVACLSGIQQPDLPEITEALSRVNLRVEGKAVREEWLALNVL